MIYREPEVAEYRLILSDVHRGSEVAQMPPKVEQELLTGVMSRMDIAWHRSSSGMRRRRHGQN